MGLAPRSDAAGNPRRSLWIQRLVLIISANGQQKETIVYAVNSQGSRLT